MPSILEKLIPLSNSTQTGARLAELQAIHQTAAERAEAVRKEYADLVEKSVTGEADMGAVAEAKARHKDAADQVELLAESVAAMQRRHDKALEAEERARKVEQWRQIVEASRKRTEKAEAFHKTLTTLSRQRAELSMAGNELAGLLPFRIDENGGAARLTQSDLEGLIHSELYRTGVTRLPGNDSTLADRPLMVDLLRDAEAWILGKRDEALRG